MKLATVCTGVGAPEQAIRELAWNYSISFGCEIDKYARTTYKANFEPHAMFEDMTKESWIGEEYESDLFVGGIPCQAFSLAGKRLGELDPRGLLFYNFYDYVKKQRPKVFIIENVKGLLSDNNGKTFQNWLQLLGKSVNTQGMMFPHPDSLEYNLHWTVLNAKDFGLPQNRERVFLVGIRPDLPNTFRFPVGWTLDLRLKDVLESNVDEKYYLSDKMLNYLNTRKDNFNGGKINYKYGNDVASCINANSKSLDISDNIIVEGEVTLNSQGGKVYSTKGISPALCSGTHGYAMGYINEPIPARMVGRNPDNPKSRKTGEYWEQTIELYEEGICGTLTTVQKDNLILEPQALVQKRTEYGKQIRKEYEAGEITAKRSEIQAFEPREDGISNTITSVQKDNLILVGGIKEGCFHEGGKTEDYPQGFRVYDEEGLSSTLSACGGGMGGKTGLYQVNETYAINTKQQGDPRVTELCATLGANDYKEPKMVYHQKRIRRLTPREVFRLQGFPDYFDISHVSETQAYKQAGNSIPVTVLKEILTNLYSILHEKILIQENQ